jgi:hypothetical protein
MSRVARFAVGLGLLSACSDDAGVTRDAGRDATSPLDAAFFCATRETEACVRNTHYWCVPDGEFLSSRSEDCAAQDKICVEGLWCVTCRPNEISCRGNNVVRCNEDGTANEVVEECLIDDGEICAGGECVNTCEQSVRDRSYQGCEFWAADLDNAGIGVGQDASAQPYAVVVSNPWPVATLVTIERNDALPGEEAAISQVTSVVVPPGDLEIFELPRREVDGASSNRSCIDAADCDRGELCVGTCRNDVGVSVGDSGCSALSDCPEAGAVCDLSAGVCRTRLDSLGVDDGTHTALTSRAYRVRSQLPIVAYQFNPLDNVGVFSNDASLLLPTSALDGTYTVNAWPQTLANTTDVNTNSNIDLRAFLTILGTEASTVVRVTLGGEVVRVLPGGPVAESFAGDQVRVTLGPFDVLNLETQGFNADFTGSSVVASAPVAVFVGSEASDAPRFEDLRTRQCCADHLEEQLIPDSALGREFIVGRMPPRTTSLNAAFLDPSNGVGMFNEPESVRVLAVAPGLTTIDTSLPAPDDRFDLGQGESRILNVRQDFLLNASLPVSVIQVLPSQAAVGIPDRLPGGDPSLIVVPPIAQYRREYVVLTPLYYGFDFITILASRTARIRLDGAALPATCTTSPADGIARLPTDPPPRYVVHRCQFSYPDVIVQGNASRVEDGLQDDGVHTLVSDEPVGVILYGFDSYVSYAYVGGLNLDRIN